MKSRLYPIFMAVFTMFSMVGYVSSARTSHPATGAKLPPPPASIDFIENMGQWNAEARFAANVPGGILYLTDKGFMYHYVSDKDLERVHKLWHDQNKDVSKEVVRHHAYEVNFIGADPKSTFSKENKKSYYHNYYLGNDPSKWATNVGLYGKLTRKEIYSGIDLQLYSESNKSLKYDLIVAPGADPSQIRMSYNGVKPKLGKGGQLSVVTSVNEVIEQAPYTYQIIGGKKIEVPSKYNLKDDVLSFEFPNGYDASHELVIDPVLVFVTYSGGGGGGNGYYAYSTTYDNAGNTYASSGAYSPGWPVSVGAFQPTFAGAALLRDVSINKYNATGSILLYSTYYGGTGNEFPNAMKVNERNELVLLGTTNSTNLPVTPGAYKTSLSGINDLFIAHFNNAGTALIGATYFGGSGSEFRTMSSTIATFDDNNAGAMCPMELGFDANNNIWVAANSNSTDIPIVSNATKNTYSVYKWICHNTAYTLGTQVLTTSGTYTETFTPVGSTCDSVVTLHLTVGRPIRDTFDIGLCPGGTYSFNGQTLSQPGYYTGHFNSSRGCDSVSVIRLFRTPIIVDTVQRSICPGTSYAFGSRQLAVAGTYRDTFTSARGCDSISVVQLSIKPYLQNTVNASTCEGTGYAFKTRILNTSGTYVDTFATSGCDSIVTLHLIVKPIRRDTIQSTMCTSSCNPDYKYNGKTYTAPGRYTDTIPGINGCHHIITMDLGTGSQNTYTYFESICPGASYSFAGQQYTTAGRYTHTFNTGCCDSTVTIDLSIRPAITNQVTKKICDGQTYVFGPQTLSSPGTYTQSFPTAFCDSTVTLQLQVLPLQRHDTIPVIICQGRSYVFGDTTFSSSGYHTNTFMNQTGCDSTVTIFLDFEPYKTHTFRDTICYGSTYVFDNQSLTTSGTYMNIYPTLGCDSVVTLHLFVRNNDTLTFTENYCSGSTYHFGNQNITSTGVYYHTFQSQSGCDSTVRLILAGPWQNSTVNSGGFDVILFSLDSTCSILKFSSYLGGTNDEAPSGLMFNRDGNIVISGTTRSTDFRVTPGVLHATAPGGSYDGFVAIIDPRYGSMVRSTYLGTTADDYATAVQEDDQGNIFILGKTAGNYPISAGVWSGNTNGDIFVDKLDPTLRQSLLSTRLGNPQNSGAYFPSAFLVDICNNIYVAGYYAAGSLPLTADAQQTTPASFWFGVMKPNFEGLLYGSYLGVNGDHGHCGVSRMDPDGIVYHSICCSSITYPGTTASSYAQTKNTSVGQDIVTFKFNFEASGVRSNFELMPGLKDTGCVPYTVSFVNTSNAAASYVWDFGDGSPQVTAANPTHTYVTPGRFTVTLYAYNPNTCITSDTSTFVITVLQTVKPQLVVSDTLLCEGTNSLGLSVQILNPTPNNVIEWTPTNAVISGGNQANVTVNPNLSSTFYVLVKDTIPGICGESSIDSIKIDLAPRVLSLLNHDSAVCEGTIVQIHGIGTPAYSYSWVPGTGLNDSTILNPTITVHESMLYTITGRYRNCKDTSINLYIEMQKNPSVELGPDISVCEGAEVALEGLVGPYRPDYTYQWTPNENLNTNGPNADLIANRSTMYRLSVETPIGCKAEDSVYVEVFPVHFGSVSKDTGYCPGGEVRLWAMGGNDYNWSPSYGLDAVNGPNVLASPATSTDYSVIIKNVHGCIDTQYVTVKVYPEATLDLPDSISIYPGEKYHITPSSNASYFNWYPPAGLSDDQVSDPLMFPSVRTRYFVTATTENGCSISDSIDVLVKETVLDMPNAFAPSGVNSKFKVSKRGIAQLKSFKIFNRWGNQVFSTTNIEDGWDGTYNGAPQPVGVYVYIVEAVTDNGTIFTRHGNVTLIR